MSALILSNRQIETDHAEQENDTLRTNMPARAVVPMSTSPFFDDCLASGAISSVSQRKTKKKYRRTKHRGKSTKSSVHDISVSPSFTGQPQSGSSKFSCIDSDPLSLLPSDHEDLSPVPHLAPYLVPLRANPIRRASNRQRLSEIMVEEESYQTRGECNDELGSFATTMSVSDSEPVERVGNGGSQRCRVDLAESLLPSDSMQYTFSAGPQAITPTKDMVPSSIQTVPQLACHGRKHRTGRSKSPTQRANLSAKEPASHPAKKQKTAIGISVPYAEPSSSVTETLSFRKDVDVITELGEASFSGSKITKSQKQQSAASSATPSLILNQRTERKRKRGETEIVSTPLEIVLTPTQRNVAPLPSNRMMQSQRYSKNGLQAPAVPSNVLGANASVVQQIIRDSATGALETLCCATEAVEEWDLEYPSVELAYPDPESDDDAAVTEQVDRLFCFPKPPLPSYPPIWSEVSLMQLFSNLYGASTHALLVATGSL
jgi:hypothetical protein